MGQYHIIVNTTKRQFLHPHRFGSGLKLLEFSSDAGGIMQGLAFLLARDNGRGGGDFDVDKSGEKLCGSWAGDRIAIVGDYGDKGEGTRDKEKSLYDEAEEGFKDVSGEVILALCRDPYVRRDTVRGLLYGFASSSDENKALLQAIRQAHPDTAEMEAAIRKEHEREVRAWQAAQARREKAAKAMHPDVVIG